MMLRMGGGAVGNADAEGGAGDGPDDCVRDGRVGDAPGVGAAGDADGESAAGSAPGVGAAGEVDGEGTADDAMVDGAAGDALTVRVLQVMGVGPRMCGRRWVWAWALATAGRGSVGRWWSVGAPVQVVLVASGVVRPSPRHSRRRVPLVSLMVRAVDVMVLLMQMARVLQVLFRVMPRVRAPWLLMMRVGGGVAGDADGEGAVADALVVHPCCIVCMAKRIGCRGRSLHPYVRSALVTSTQGFSWMELRMIPSPHLIIRPGWLHCVGATIGCGHQFCAEVSGQFGFR